MNLARMFSTIQQEFNKDPPLPQKAAKYTPEPISLKKPSTEQLKQDVERMAPDQVKGLVEDREMFFNNLMCLPEVEDINKKVAAQKQEVQQMVEDNRKRRTELSQQLIDLACK